MESGSLLPLLRASRSGLLDDMTTKTGHDEMNDQRWFHDELGIVYNDSFPVCIFVIQKPSRTDYLGHSSPVGPVLRPVILSKKMATLMTISNFGTIMTVHPSSYLIHGYNFDDFGTRLLHPNRQMWACGTYRNEPRHVIILSACVVHIARSATGCGNNAIAGCSAVAAATD